MKNYTNEREGQIEFYETFLPAINPALTLDEIINDDNDGVLNGNLLEFKLRINDLNTTLFQCIKYLSALRIKGKPVPSNIILIDLDGEIAYLYKSETYLGDIEKVYNGGASRANTGFTGQPYNEKYSYGDNALDTTKLIQILKANEFIRIHIDENCIVGWATSYYKTVPNARKEDFLGDDTGQHRTIGEIRNPSVFAEYIYPYTGETNVRFQYLMDKLNDTIQKKNLGAFYTPQAYAEKTHELLRKAIERVPEENDYVIIDRCAGTGNLEKDLTDEELSHCILSTVEYYEYKVMMEILGSKVRHIIPPVEATDSFQAGLVKGSDALSEEFIENPIIKQYLDNPECTIILFENPPYAEPQARTQTNRAPWKRSFVLNKMREEIRGTATNELGNAFIWSTFKYYLRQPTDSYIVYSPVKYWKAHKLIDKHFIEGFVFNRRWFHTNIDACVSAILWSNEDEVVDSIFLHAYNYDSGNNCLIDEGILPVHRVYNMFSGVMYDKRQFNDDTSDGIAIAFDGSEVIPGTKNITINPIYNENILGYMRVGGFNFDNPDLESGLLVAGCYNGHGFYLRKDNYLEKIPMFCATRYITYNRKWTERARIMKSADGAERFYTDMSSGILDQWLCKCLLFTCIEMQNHMRTFIGSDERFYRNDLCLDITNGETIAFNDLRGLQVGSAEQQILDQWNILLEAAKQTEEYNSELTYGVYQIYAEIDTSYKDDDGKTVWNNLEVHSALQTMKALCKEYYNNEIVPTLFEYEFLK